MTELVIRLVVMVVMGVACALIAQNRGRSPVGWFFVGFLTGCIGLILVLVLQDLKVQEQRERHLANENRRLKERLKKERLVADQRHAELSRRIVAHDVALGVDTSSSGALPAPPPSSQEMEEHRAAQWYWADGDTRKGPVAFGTLRRHWDEGKVGVSTRVWRHGMTEWKPVAEVHGLAEALDETIDE